MLSVCLHRFPNGTRVFVPVTNDTVPEPLNGTYFLFNIDEDPTETNNLAATMPVRHCLPASV
jgi:hypothetical protein